MSFSQLGLTAELVRAVSEEGYREPTPVQRQAIPVILEGNDVLAGAQTGTGKTAGFTLPLLHRLQQQPRPSGGKASLRALILTPTRELAAQVGESVSTYGKYLPLRSAVIFGGVSINPQIAQLRRGVDILTATPGRLLDHIGQKTIDLSRLEILVLDEADRMLDMGFIRDIRKILALLPPNGRGGRQNLLFSATFSDEIRALANGLLHDPVPIEVARRNTAVETVAQRVHPVDRVRKAQLLAYLIGSRNWHQVLVFTRTKHGANRLAAQLEKDGISAAAIHGNKSQGARTRALADFKRGAVRVLVATDIAARGLDIDQLPHVVNFELPNIAEDYVHRIGRTGRAGNAGEAISLVCIDEHAFLRGIEKLIQQEIPKEVIEGFAPDPSIRAEPVFKPRAARPARAKRGGDAASRPGGHTSGQQETRGSKHSRRKSAGATGNSTQTTGQHKRPQQARASRRPKAARPGS